MPADFTSEAMADGLGGRGRGSTHCLALAFAFELGASRRAASQSGSVDHTVAGATAAQTSRATLPSPFGGAAVPPRAALERAPAEGAERSESTESAERFERIERSE